MADIIATFSDGRLLVQEDRAVDTDTISGGYVTLRIGGVRKIEKLVALGAAYVSGRIDDKLATDIKDTLVSGDTLRVQLRRLDQPNFLSGYASGLHSYGYLSGLTSGLGFYGTLASGKSTSGLVRVMANVIAH